MKGVYSSRALVVRADNYPGRYLSLAGADETGLFESRDLSVASSQL
jgi:hypothetical protein